MDLNTELKNMILAFRVSELQSLMNYAGRSRSGRKPELQARALDLIRTKPSHVITKIRELYRSMQIAPNTPITVSTASDLYYNSNPKVATRLYTASSGYAGAAEKVLQGRSPYAHYATPAESPSKPQGGVSIRSVPICPDVKFKKLPFYDVQCELIKPTSLRGDGPVRMQEGQFPFCLTPQQAQDIAASKEVLSVSPYTSEQKIGYQVQVQLRFCLMDTTCEQTDNFPPSICVKINGITVPLPQPVPSNRPGVEPKRPSRPVNVTNYVKLSPLKPNVVSVTWVSDGTGRSWVMCLYLVKKLTSTYLLTRLKAKKERPADFTKGMIKEIVSKDDGDCQIAMTSLKVSVACPLGKCRMNLPTRASTCSHLQCFDASLFLQMNEKKPTWACPVCDKPILVENLSIDGYFLDVIKSLAFDACNDIEVFPDGSWKPLITIKKEKIDEPPAKRAKSEVKVDMTICLDDELVIEDDDELPRISSPPATATQEVEKTVQVVDLVSSSSSSSEDEEEDIRPPRIRRRPPRIQDESSSSSSASSESSSSSSSTESSSSSASSGSAVSRRETTKSGTKSVVAPKSGPPTVITLDSSSPSPSPEYSQAIDTGISSSYGLNASSINAELVSTSSHMFGSSSYTNSYSSNYPMSYSSGGSGQPGSSRRTSSPGLLLNPLASGSGQSSFDPRGIWDSNFQGGSCG